MLVREATEFTAVSTAGSPPCTACWELWNFLCVVKLVCRSTREVTAAAPAVVCCGWRIWLRVPHLAGGSTHMVTLFANSNNFPAQRNFHKRLQISTHPCDTSNSNSAVVVILGYKRACAVGVVGYG